MDRQSDPSPRSRRQLLKGLAVAGSVPLIARFSPARAAWPGDKPIRFVVPFAPGGPADVVARVVAQGLGETLAGSTIVVENKAGAGGNIGVGQVARAEPDGYTLVVTSSAFMLNPSLYETVPYDPVKDFEPVSLMVTSPNAFVAHPSSGVKTLADLIARCKAEPDKMNYASPGVGTTPMLSFELLKIRAGIKPAHIAHNGAGPAVQAVVAGTTQFACTALPPLHPHIQAGALNGLALTSQMRWHDLPNVPTMKEAGFDDFLLDTKIILAAPARTPAAIVEQMSKAVVGALKKPAAWDTMQKAGFEVLAQGPDGLRAAIAKEVPMWKGVVEQAGVRLK
jgi:tripartite-type tricarboxylate transporter receptor subunit TctC